MTSLSAKVVAAEALPVIDVSALRSGTYRERVKVGAALRLACLDKGFFYIKGHKIPPSLLAKLFQESERFFDLPTETKNSLHKRNSNANRGYEPIGGQRLEDGAPPDLKESLFIGVENAPDDPRVVAGEFNRGPNQWPNLPGFGEVVEAYSSLLTDLGHDLYRGLALSLSLDEGYFDEFYRDPLNILRMIHYPQQPANPLPNQKGCGAHTDFGGITILAQDAIGGLQVWDEQQGWIHATPIEGAFVVNLGDFMARWTNERYKSTLHRVVNASGKERYSIPYFVNGSTDHEVSCIQTCLAPGEQPKYPPITVARHFGAMYSKTYLS